MSKNQVEPLLHITRTTRSKLHPANQTSMLAWT